MRREGRRVQAWISLWVLSCPPAPHMLFCWDALEGSHAGRLLADSKLNPSPCATSLP